MAMRKTGYITILLTGFLATLLLGSCSTDDVAELPLEEGVPVRFEIKRDGIMSRAPGDAALSVNRILILPFGKRMRHRPTMQLISFRNIVQPDNWTSTRFRQ